MIYAPNVDPNSKPEIGFIAKPDADGMQENMIDHLQKSIYENTGIANLRDENFAGNASGVAMQYKLLSMKDKADSKERKFTKSLRQLYKTGGGKTPRNIYTGNIPEISACEQGTVRKRRVFFGSPLPAQPGDVQDRYFVGIL